MAATTKLVEMRCEHCRGEGAYVTSTRNSATYRQCVKCHGKGRRMRRVPVAKEN